MASHELIDAYLTTLARRLPAATVDELADGLLECWHRHRTDGLPPDPAARAAIAEFGPADRITDAFIAQAPGRRLARRLLATGWLFGIVWGASLVLAQAWTWSVPRVAVVGLAVTFVAIIAALACAATARRTYRRTRVGLLAALALAALDATLVGGFAWLAPAFVWPLAVAIPASLARIGVTLVALPRRPFGH